VLQGGLVSTPRHSFFRYDSYWLKRQNRKYDTKYQCSDNFISILRFQLHCLCSSKSTETYQLMFCELKRTLLNSGLLYRPKSFNVDFELYMLNAIRSHFPNAITHGCYFHYCQAVYRKLAESHQPSWVIKLSIFGSRKYLHVHCKKILASPTGKHGRLFCGIYPSIYV